MSGLATVFEGTRGEGRAALAGYLPVGYPTPVGSRDSFAAMLDGGADFVEVGVPYSDPVMDGPTIQLAGETALKAGFRLKHVFEAVEGVSARGGNAVVMTYWNLVRRYGVEAFARDLAAAGGLGMITPDLIPDEASDWLEASRRHGLDRIFLVAPSSSEERIDRTVRECSGFVYATAVMGVTGARDQVGAGAAELVRRTRAHTDLPVGVGLGVRSREQAAEVAGFADAVIVGSALVTRAAEGPEQVRALTAELAEGVRQPVAA
ncbi:MAG TPA: tryptophan synthase subunit alpha [Amycolatopsis sp.]|uniref:tryptophan synthase subunit alpha n=1 Tax=Amycolatopsis sp. TaxID=37632 RepID=UPI002B467F39|nr:tryptophan synthase subunit alpha [Amycolatopsis sp.]HKS48750.1 tryptophan synthase subunit alpha [Amycolatopsis sp.]